MVVKALSLLGNHHCRPHYKEMYNKGWKSNNMSWGPWSPQVPKQAKTRKRDDKKDNNKKEDGIARPYDADTSSMQQQSSASSSTPEAQFVQEFMAMIKENNLEMPERLQKFAPDEAKASIKEQQKVLNRRRNLKNKIDGKRRAIEADKTKWENWLQSMKNEVQQQKAKFEESQKKLNQELDQLLQEEKKLDLPEEEAMEDVQGEMDIEDILDECAQELQEKVKENSIRQEEVLQNRLQEMQTTMEKFYANKLEEQRLHFMEMIQNKDTKENKEVVDLENDEKLKIGLVDALGVVASEPPKIQEEANTQGVRKDARAPFGVQRSQKTVQNTAPYSPQQKMEALLKTQQQKEKEKAQEAGKDVEEALKLLE